MKQIISFLKYFYAILDIAKRNSDASTRKVLSDFTRVGFLMELVGGNQ